MSKITYQEKKRRILNIPTYTAKIFFELKDELDKYKTEKELSIKGNEKNKEKIKGIFVEGIQKWYVDKGALSENKEWVIKDISKYRELNEKLNQFYDWCHRREYAQNKSLEEEYEQTAEILSVNSVMDF